MSSLSLTLEGVVSLFLDLFITSFFCVFRQRGKGTSISSTSIMPAEASNEIEETPASSIPCFDILKFVLPAMMPFVILKYQGNPEMLIEEKVVSFWSFFIALFVYANVALAWTDFPNLMERSQKTLMRAAYVSGISQILLLSSIFMPREVSLAMGIVTDIFAAVAMVWPIVVNSEYNLQTKISSVYSCIHDNISKGIRSNLGKEEAVSPV